MEAQNKEYLPDCLCGSGEKAIYICVDEKCDNNQNKEPNKVNIIM